MKKIKVVLFSLLLLLAPKVFAQHYATETWMAENFGKRFISAKEIGLGELKSPFTEDELRNDKTSWIVPYKDAYHLVQFRFIRNTFEANDTLLLQETKELVQIFLKTGRQFPNIDGIVFLRTGDLYISDGIEYAKTIVLDKKGYRVIDLPTNVKIVIVGKESNRYSYVSDIAGGISISINADDSLNKGEELYGASVITPINLFPSQ